MRSERMTEFLRGMLAVHRFEEMRIPLGIVATDLRKGEPVLFQRKGEVFDAIRASCAYPGLFLPVKVDGRLYVDGGMSMDVPAPAAKEMGARHIIAVSLGSGEEVPDPSNMAAVIRRCFQILQSRTRAEWAAYADVILEPGVNGVGWNGFDSAEAMIASGRRAAEAVLPRILGWLG
jgi:NTE family protein